MDPQALEARRKALALHSEPVDQHQEAVLPHLTQQERDSVDLARAVSQLQHAAYSGQSNTCAGQTETVKGALKEKGTLHHEVGLMSLTHIGEHEAGRL